MNPTMEPLNNSAPLTNKEKMARLKRLAAERDERDRQYLERQQAEQQNDGDDPAADGEQDQPQRRQRPQRVFPRNVPRSAPRSPVRAPPSRLGRGGAAPARTNSRDAKVELNALRNAYCKQQKQVADLSSTEDKMARLKRLQEERAEADRRYAASRRQA